MQISTRPSKGLSDNSYRHAEGMQVGSTIVGDGGGIDEHPNHQHQNRAHLTGCPSFTLNNR